MAYRQFKVTEVFAQVSTEDEARELFWEAKSGGGFECSRCCHEHYYEFQNRPEVRRCRQCGKQIRLRAGTVLEHSKMPLLIWARMLALMMQDKRGVSALHVKRELGLSSYRTVWGMLHKVRRALRHRDDRYILKDLVELDGASFGRESTHKKGRRRKTPVERKTGADDVLIAVETKSWVDDQGRAKERAGFAKVTVARETKIFAQQFVNKAIAPGTMVNTDAGAALTNLEGVMADHQVMNSQPERLDRWLPWVHRFISNAKTWMMGTHHGVGSLYLTNYLAETTYRFNRRHDPDGMFHRALTACVLAPPVRLWALCG